MGLSAACDVIFSDDTHLLFFEKLTIWCQLIFLLKYIMRSLLA